MVIKVGMLLPALVTQTGLRGKLITVMHEISAAEPTAVMPAPARPATLSNPATPTASLKRYCHLILSYPDIHLLPPEIEREFEVKIFAGRIGNVTKRVSNVELLNSWSSLIASSIVIVYLSYFTLIQSRQRVVLLSMLVTYQFRWCAPFSCLDRRQLFPQEYQSEHAGVR